MIKRIIRKCLQKCGYDLVKIYVPKTLNGHLSLQIGRIKLLLPSQHALPSFFNRFPNYSRNLSRIVKYISVHNPHFSIIDVGANVGDSVALIMDNVSTDVHIYCIEGDPIFLPYLKKNVSDMGNVTIFETYLSDSIGHENGKLLNENGTARIVSGNQTNELGFTTLDDLSNTNPELAHSKLLKIDTDGFDLKIIRGGMDYISKANPILFFEYDFDFLSSIGDDGISTLKTLHENGYEHMLVYDNFGRLLISLKRFDLMFFTQLSNYITGKKGAIDYYDICFLHKNDENLFNEIQKKEIEHFQRN